MFKKGLRVCLLLLAAAFPCRAENITLTIVHTNDIHGWIMPRPAAFYKKNPRRLIGGAAALARLYRKTPGPKLLLDSGDWFQGTPEGTLTRGRAVAEIFNAIPYDAVEIGNHEFDFGEKILRDLVARIEVPVLGANVYRGGARAGYLRPWIIKEVAGVKVGVFGLLTSRMERLAFARHREGLEFRREVDEARDAVKALRARGATVILALTHVGFERTDSAPFEGDQTLATEVGGIDVILGGHTHTALAEPLRDAAHGTLICQAGSGLTRAGVVTLEISPETKKVVSSRGRLADLWVDEMGEDPEIAALVRRNAAAMASLDVVVATASAALLHERRFPRESALGGWIADCERSWAGTDVAFQNASGILADMPQGPVTLRALFNIMPFDNRIVKLRLRGATIGEILEHGIGGRGMIQTSGLRVSYNGKKPKGRRIVSVSVGGRPLRPEAVYTAAAADFMVEGGSGYTPFERALAREQTSILLRDALTGCARAQGLIVPPPAGRMASVEE